MRETRTRAPAEGTRRVGVAPPPAGAPDAPALPEAPAPVGPDGPTEPDGRAPSLRDVLANRPFRALWIAQVFSQFAQNLTWIALGAFVQNQTGKSTFVSILTVSAMLAQLLLSGFAGVLVDRASKRGVLVASNAIRVVLALFFVAMTRLDVGVQTTGIIALVFVANAVAQFFTPAEASTIPLIVEKRNLLAASSLFNITLNACQAAPAIFGLLLLDLIGIVPVLLGVAACYVVAALFVATLPEETTVSRPIPVAGSLRASARHLADDAREAIHFLARDPGLRLTIFQINIAPTFLFVFATLGLKFVQVTFNLPSERTWLLLVPAGAGLVAGALGMGRVAARARKESLINVGLLTLGVAVTVLGAVAPIADAFGFAAGRAGSFIGRHVHSLPAEPRNLGLIGPAMAIAVVIGLAMALSTIPAQTLVFERTSEEVRGRVLAAQQLIGGAIPIVPLLVVAPLADLFGPAAVMTGLGVAIVLVGALSIHLDRGMRKSPHPPTLQG